MVHSIKINVLTVLAVLFMVFSGGCASEPPLGEGPYTVFTDVNVVPMDGPSIQSNMDVVISGDRIHRIAPHGSLGFPEGTTIIEASGKYLMPGIAEMHGHIPPTAPSPNWPDRYMEDVLFLYLAGGVTTVRGMLGFENQLDIKAKVISGELLGPNLYLAGPSFSGNSVRTSEDARERVRQQVQEGWDLLKVHPGVALDVFKAMAEEANELGIAFAGHIPENVGLENALRLGQETVDHLDGYIEFMGALEQPVTDEMLEQALQLSLEHDVWVIPTQALWETLIGAADKESLRAYDELKYMPPQIVASWNNFLDRQENSFFFRGDHAAVHAENRQRLLKALSDGGVRILLGTDAPQLFSVPGLAMKHELAIMEAAGMGRYEILVSGTRNVGEYFADKDRFGTVTEGSRADLILMTGNPLDDLDFLVNHQGVMIRGNWLSRDDIDQKLNAIEEYYRNQD